MKLLRMTLYVSALTLCMGRVNAQPAPYVYLQCDIAAAEFTPRNDNQRGMSSLASAQTYRIGREQWNVYQWDTGAWGPNLCSSGGSHCSLGDTGFVLVTQLTAAMSA